MHNIFPCGPKDKPKPAENVVIINVTSSSKTWHKCFSPFFLGPCKLYGKGVSRNMENAWQYAKVYKDQLADNGNPNGGYWDWAFAGWDKYWADRYPMGRGAKPEYTWWDGEKLGYIEARKKVYEPLYRSVVSNRQLEDLVEEVEHYLENGISVYLWDYDGYNHIKLNKSLEDVKNDPKRKMGHVFVLYEMIIEKLWANQSVTDIQKN